MSRPICSVDGCIATIKGRGLCQKHYYRWRRNGDPLTVRIIVGDDKKRILSSIKKSKAGCWVWQKTIHAGGYGIVSLRGKHEMAHRAAWKVLVGEIPEGMQLNHTCHNRACINPDHLYLGTQIDNMRDMQDAGRENKALGERGGMTVLTEVAVREIRKLIGEGWTNKDIARVFGVAPTTVSSIKRKRTWRWLK